jgi:hypothetical protein
MMMMMMRIMIMMMIMMIVIIMQELIIIYERLQDLIFLFKIHMDTWKDFFKIYGQFGHVPSNRFASPDLGEGGSIKIHLTKKDRHVNWIELTKNEGLSGPTRKLLEALICRCYNGKYLASILRFPHTREFLWKLSVVWAHALIKVCQPWPKPKKFKEYQFEGQLNISMLVTPNFWAKPGPVVCSFAYDNWTF